MQEHLKIKTKSTERLSDGCPDCSAVGGLNAGTMPPTQGWDNPTACLSWVSWCGKTVALALPPAGFGRY